MTFTSDAGEVSPQRRGSVGREDPEADAWPAVKQADAASGPGGTLGWDHVSNDGILETMQGTRKTTGWQFGIVSATFDLGWGSVCTLRWGGLQSITPALLRAVHIN